MPRFPGFVGPTYADKAAPVDAQETFNLFPERVESGSGSAEWILRKAPGKRLFATLADGPIRGMFAQDGRAFVAAGGTVYELFSNGTATQRILIALGDDPVGFASSGQVGNQMMVVAGGAGTYLNLSTNASFGIVSAGFPSAAVGAAYLDGYFLTRAGVAVHASGLNDASSWSASSKGQRSIASDDLQAFVVDGHRTLWYVGSKSSEPWFDNALSPYAFTPIPSAFMEHGTGAPFSVSRFDNSVFMLGQSEHGDRYAFIVGNGYTAQRVSTHAVEQAWRTYATVSDARTFVYSDEGHIFAVVTFPSANATWVYDAATKLWHRRGKWDSGEGRFDADTCWCHCFAFGKHLVGSRTTGKVYELSTSIYDDDSDPLRWVRRSPHLNGERDWTYFDRFELVAHTGVGLASGQGSDPLVMLRTSDDRGRTWSHERTATLGARGAYDTTVEWWRLGRARQRVFEVSGSDPVPVTLIDAYLDAR